MTPAQQAQRRLGGLSTQRGARQKREQWLATMALKLCEGCGEPMEVRDGEAQYDYALRKSHNRKCQGEAQSRRARGLPSLADPANHERPAAPTPEETLLQQWGNGFADVPRVHDRETCY